MNNCYQLDDGGRWIPKNVVVPASIMDQIRINSQQNWFLCGRTIPEERLTQVFDLLDVWHGFVLPPVAFFAGSGGCGCASQNKDFWGPVLKIVGTNLLAECQGHTVQVFEYDETDYHSRHRQLIISQKMRGRKAAIVGCGSIGSKVASELSKHDIELGIFDPDTVSVSNLYRLAQGGFGVLSIGRNKGHALREFILSDVPSAEIEVYPIDVCKDQAQFRDELVVTKPDLVVISTDTRDSVRVTNAVTRELAIPVLQITLSDGADSGQIRFSKQQPGDSCLLCTEQDDARVALRDSRQQYAEETSAAQHAVPALSVNTTIIAALGAKIAMAYLAGEDIGRYFTSAGAIGDIMWFSTTPDTWILEDFAQKLVAIVEKRSECKGCWIPTKEEILLKNAKRKESKNEK